MAIVIKFLKDLGPVRFMISAAAILLALSLMGFFIFNISRPGMVTLYSGLDEQDSNKIIQELEAKKIDFQVNSDGSVIKVAENQLLPARVALAQASLPSRGAVVGYEIFDKEEALGTTNFQQNVKMLRALEGELSRTILAFRAVNKVRVHLVMPQKELFSKDKQETRASIIIDTKGFETLAKSEVDAIAHLVATSVPNLDFRNITIVDTKGRSLKVGNKENESYGSSDQQEYKNSYTSKLQSSIEELLERSLGAGKVKVHASVDMNFDKVVINSETFDPDNVALRSTQISEESEKNSTNLEDNFDVSALNNLPGSEEVSPSGNAALSSKLDETKNFEISKVVKSQVLESGVITKLSVAVMIDGIYVKNPQDGTMQYQARSREELAKIENLVKVAIGYNEDRNDRVEVMSMPFVSYFEEPIENKTPWTQDNIMPILKTFIIAMSALLTAIFVVRPIFAQLIEAKRPFQSEKHESNERQELSAELAAIKNTATKSDIRVRFKNITETVKDYPEESLIVIRQWLNRD
jgi:flagellar M-ring protein FliF